MVKTLPFHMAFFTCTVSQETFINDDKELESILADLRAVQQKAIGGKIRQIASRNFRPIKTSDLCEKARTFRRTRKCKRCGLPFSIASVLGRYECKRIQWIGGMTEESAWSHTDEYGDQASEIEVPLLLLFTGHVSAPSDKNVVLYVNVVPYDDADVMDISRSTISIATCEPEKYSLMDCDS